MTDSEATRTLIERSRAGDRVALESLLIQHLPSLEAYVRLKAGPVVRAKESMGDLVQSVCREVLDDLETFEYRTEGEFRHWLFQQALHKIINKNEFYRAAKRDAVREANPASNSAASLSQCYATLCTPSRGAEGREAIEAVEKAFDSLPDEYKEAVTLRRLVQLPYADIAEKMGKSEGAVRNLVSRGLARLAILID